MSSSQRSSWRTRSSPRYKTTGEDLGRLTRRARRLLAHHRNKAAHLSAIALNDRGEFRALRRRHADALDDHIIDFVAAVVVGDQPPIDLQRRRVAGADDVRRYDHPVAIAVAAADLECL